MAQGSNLAPLEKVRTSEYSPMSIRRMVLYSRLPLKTDGIRLVHLYPAKCISSTIEIDVVSYELDSAPPYEALSYRWGSANDLSDILIKSMRTSFALTSNLLDALKRLRLSSETRIIWVDSICINQSNIRERSEQTQNMGRIFSKAQCVRMWLGEAAENSESAIRLLQACSKLSSDGGAVSKAVLSTQGCEGLIELLNRPYWQRMWVFQEIVLAQRATVMCGASETDWEYFKKAESWVGTSQTWAKMANKHPELYDLGNALSRISQFCVSKEEAEKMINVLHPTRHLQATDPRDKIYALMGLCSGDFPRDFSADYSKSTREVFIEFATQVIRHGESISVVLTAGLWNPQNGEDIQLPTWVPDFRDIHGVDMRYIAASHLMTFGTDDDYKDSQRFSISEGKLEVEGVVLDVITDVIPLEESEQNRIMALKRFTSKEMEPHPSECPPIYALFQTMVFQNWNMGSKTTRASKVKTTRLILGFAHDWLKLDRDVSQYMLEKFFNSFNPTDVYPLRTHYYSRSKEKLNRLRLEYLNLRQRSVTKVPSAIFATRKKYIAIGRREVLEGDLVCKIWGCRLPLLLRSCGSAYQLIGPCYVYGAMGGKSDSHGKKADKMREFRIV